MRLAVVMMWNWKTTTPPSVSSAASRRWKWFHTSVEHNGKGQLHRIAARPSVQKKVVRKSKRDPPRPHDDGGRRKRHTQPHAGVSISSLAKHTGRDPNQPANPLLGRRHVHRNGFTDPGHCGTAADPSDRRNR